MPGGIQIHIPCKEAAADARLRLSGHWDRRTDRMFFWNFGICTRVRVAIIIRENSQLYEYKKDAINSYILTLNYLKTLYTIYIKENTVTPRSAQLCPSLF
jgi:hypothetical protein